MTTWVEPVARYVGLGLVVTLELAAVAVVASVIFGTALGSLLTLPNRAVRLLIRSYVELWRGLPIIITLFFIFFALPAVGLDVSTFLAAAVGLTLWGSANVAEIVRGAVQSIPATQGQAGRALGFSWLSTMRHVILPQAVRRGVPPMVGLLTNLIQSTTLAALIGVTDILESAQRSVERLTLSDGDPHSVAILGAVLVIFFIICFPLTVFSRRLERRLG